MHEVSIAEEIKNIVLEKVREHKAKKVKKIVLDIGELTSIVPESLEFAFSIVSKNTPMENSKVKINLIKMKGKCNNCKAEFLIEEFNYLCPECGSGNIKLINGKEMIIKTIDME